MLKAMPNIGPVELIVVLLIVLVIVGPKKLPGLGKSLGTGMREFKESVTGDHKDHAPELEEHRQASAPVAPPVAEPAPLTKDPVDPPAPPRAAGE